MAKFTYHIVQTNVFEVEIEAASEEEVEKIFDDYITDDFGEPTSSIMEITGPIETTYEVVSVTDEDGLVHIVY